MSTSTMMRTTVKLGIAFALLATTLAFAILMTQRGPELAETDTYLIIAHAPPFSRAELLAALEEIKNYTIWASWAGDVGIAVGCSREAIEKDVSSPQGLHGTFLKVGDKPVPDVEAVVKKVGKSYRAEVIKGGKPNMTYVSEDLEDVLWWIANVSRHVDIPLGDKIIWYKLDLPVFWFAYAIPLCNGTYYGPWPPPIMVAGDTTVKVQVFPENRTIVPIKLPKPVPVNVTRVGESWFGHYVVDACALPFEVEKSLVLALVHKDYVEKVMSILSQVPYVTVRAEPVAKR